MISTYDLFVLFVSLTQFVFLSYHRAEVTRAEGAGEIGSREVYNYVIEYRVKSMYCFFTYSIGRLAQLVRALA